MWTKRRRSYFLLIRIRAPKRVNIILPLSLVALEQILIAFFDLASVAKDLFPVRWLRIPMRKGSVGLRGKELSLGEILALLREVWVEMRSYGQWKMVDIESEDARVEIRFF